MAPLTLKWNKNDITVELSDTSDVEELKMLLYSQTNVPPERMKILGLGGGGVLKDGDDLQARLKKTKAGAKLQLLGTAEGGEIKDVDPSQKTKFVEDMTAEEVAKIMKEKKVEILPCGLSNLGNTCFANSTLHVLKTVKELRHNLTTPLATNPGAASSAAGGDMMDSLFVAALRNLFGRLDNTTDAIVPGEFIIAMRRRFPQFAQQTQQGGFMQQDAEEFMRETLSVVSNECGVQAGSLGQSGRKLAKDGTEADSSAGNLVDALFGFQMRSKYRCLESDEEPVDVKTENQRVFICHLGTTTEPVNHLHEGIKLSLKEHVEKATLASGPLGGRTAQWEKQSAMSELPPYLFVQIARFGYKQKNELSGVAASRVKHVRKCAFNPTLDVFDYCSEELQTVLKVGRQKAQEKKEDEDARQARKIAAAGNPMKPAKKDEKDAMEVDQEGDKEVAASTAAPTDSKKPKVVDQLVPNELSGIPEGPGHRKEFVNNPDNLPLKDFPTGQYELSGIISHKGRSADGGHYVSWVRAKKAADEDDDEDEGEATNTAVATKKKTKKPKDSGEDTWYCFDDDDVTAHLYKQITGVNIDLQGGRADTQIAYVLLFKRQTCIMPDCPPRGT